MLVMSYPASGQVSCKRLVLAKDLADAARLNRYRIATTNNASLNGLSASDFQVAVRWAADSWNNQGAGGHFQYIGTTASDALPPAQGSCGSPCDLNKVIVVVGFANGPNDPPNVLGQVTPLCNSGVSMKFECWALRIFTHRRDALGVVTENEWFSGQREYGKFDIVGILTHEFGHTLNLGHPESDTNLTMHAVMRAGADAAIGTTTWRDLYEYDTRCVTVQEGRREATPYRIALASGAFSTPLVFSSFSASTASASYSYKSGAWSSASAFRSQSCAAWSRPLTSGGGHECVGANSLVVSPTAALWREQPSRDRVTFVSHTEVPLGGQYAQRRVDMR